MYEAPKEFWFAVLLLSVVAFALALAIHATRGGRAAGQTRLAPAVVVPRVSPSDVAGETTPAGTPSAEAQRRAIEFNDATSRFNAPDSQPH